MISTIHSRTHQIYCTGIYADILFMCMLLMDCFCDKAAIRSHHETAKLCIDRNITHSFRNKYFFINLAETLTDHTDIIWLLIRFIRNSDTTGKVDEFNVCTCLLLKLHGKLKHNLCKHWIIIIGHCVACKECMDSELFGTFGFQDTECVKNLLGSHSVFCISGIIHDTVTDLKYSTWIVTAADHFRDFSESFLYALNMCDVIKVDDPTDLICISELFLRCVIGRKHDIALFAAYCLSHHKLCL